MVVLRSLSFYRLQHVFRMHELKDDLLIYDGFASERSERDVHQPAQLGDNASISSHIQRMHSM